MRRDRVLRGFLKLLGPTLLEARCFGTCQLQEAMSSLFSLSHFELSFCHL